MSNYSALDISFFKIPPPQKKKKKKNFPSMQNVTLDHHKKRINNTQTPPVLWELCNLLPLKIETRTKTPEPLPILVNS